MKYVQSITFRALSALFVGGLLIAFPKEISSWLVIVIGVLFLIPGMVSIGAYFVGYSKNEAMRPIFPIVGAGSVFFGLILTLFPTYFVPYIKYVLAAFLVLASIAELIQVFQMRRYTEVGAFFFVIPMLIACAGLFVIFFNKLEGYEYNMILGVASIIYAIQELLNAIRFRKVRREFARAKVEAQVPVLEEAAPDTEVATSKITEAEVVEEDGFVQEENL